MCIIDSFGIDAIRKKLPRYADMSIAIILSAGVGLAGVLSGFVRSAASFNSFLFGSIVAISDGELYTCLLYTSSTPSSSPASTPGRLRKSPVGPPVREPPS